MNTAAVLKPDDTEYIQKSSSFLCTSAKVDKLIYVVRASAKTVFQTLGPGLPKCVYQLNIYNDLLKKGLQLNIKMSMLDHCVQNEPAREMITVNDKLLIECVVENRIIEHFQKRIMFDLENVGYSTGLLINFSDQTEDRMTTVIELGTVIH